MNGDSAGASLNRAHVQALFARAKDWPPDGNWQPVVEKAVEHFERFLREHEKTGQLLVWVPGGKFTTDTDGNAFEIELPAFYIGVHPVTNAQYARFVEATKHRAPEQADWGTPVWKNGRFPEEKATQPVVCVSWDDAQAYCQWAGMKLPTELQWEKAARWQDGRKYPWGPEWDQNKCRNSNTKGNETTATVWQYAVGASAWGGYQMSGNVWEWCEDWYDSKAYERYRRGDLTPPASGSSRVVRGGSWYSDPPGNFTASHRHSNTPHYRYNHLGFRCVVGAEFSPWAGEKSLTS